MTSTGVLRLVLVPSPSWPLLFNPQHLTPPEVVTAQVCSPPPEICATWKFHAEGPVNTPVDVLKVTPVGRVPARENDDAVPPETIGSRVLEVCCRENVVDWYDRETGAAGVAVTWPGSPLVSGPQPASLHARTRNR